MAARPVPVSSPPQPRVLVLGRPRPKSGRDVREGPACGSCVSDVEVLKVERVQLIDAVLNLCTYHHPKNIQLPPG